MVRLAYRLRGARLPCGRAHYAELPIGSPLYPDTGEQRNGSTVGRLNDRADSKSRVRVFSERERAVELVDGRAVSGGKDNDAVRGRSAICGYGR